jgi:hypothetical protein
VVAPGHRDLGVLHPDRDVAYVDVVAVREHLADVLLEARVRALRWAFFLKAKRDINSVCEVRGFLKAKRYINSVVRSAAS